MKRAHTATAWVIAVLILAGAATARADEDLQVLFIGNSFTYNNNLPRLIAELARAGKERPLRVADVGGGGTLEQHWNRAEVLTKLRSRKWDYVVLQEYTLRAIDGRDKMDEYTRKFDAEIKKQGARTLLYSPWAWKSKPENLAPITKAHQELAKELKAAVVPVGTAWETVLAADKQLNLHAEDGRHPNLAGSYLAACVFYSVIYGKSPAGLPGRIGGLTDEQAKPLQEFAWKAARK